LGLVNWHVINFILPCNRCDAKGDTHDISLLIRMAGIHSRTNGWFTLTRKCTFKGTSPTNHFCTDR